MRSNRAEVLAKWTISAGLVGGGFYTASLGQSFTAGIAFGGVALMNIEMARIIHYLASTSLPPPNYDDQYEAYDQEQEPPRQRNRRNDD